MKRRDPRSAALFAVAVAAGLALGFVHRAPGGAPFPRHPSAWTGSKTPDPVLTYDRLPCPTDEQLRALAARVKLELPPEGNYCQHPDLGPLGKLLLFTSTLRLAIPPDWAPSLRPDLEDPFGFLERSLDKLGFDLAQTESIAYRKGPGREVYLGGIFFSLTPLEGLSVLMHEARHTSPDDPGHVLCRRGDIPRAGGGCDEELSVDPKVAGAYSYGAAFYAAVGLFADPAQVPEPDRERMRSLALQTISTRFNRLPESLARAFDVVALLGADGRVFVLHPFAREPVPLAFDFPREDEKIERLELNVSNNGLLLFTSRARAFTWSPADGTARLYQKHLDEALPVLDAARVRNLFGDYPFYTFLTGDRQLQYVSYDASARRYVLKPYATFPEGAVPPPLSRLFMGLNARSLFLARDGQLLVSQKWGSDPPFQPRRDLQVPGRYWVQGTGGVVFESLYGVTNDGRVQFTRTDYVPAAYPGDESEEEIYLISESSFQAKGEARGRKLLEGLTFRALLDSEQRLTFETYDRQVRSEWRKDGFPLADFAIFRRHLADSALLPSATADFAARCHVHGAVPDPWLGYGLGLDEQNRLVIGTADGCLVAGETRYTSIQLGRAQSRQPPSPSEERKPRGWWDAEMTSRTVLKAVTETGETKILRPYDYR